MEIKCTKEAPWNGDKEPNDYVRHVDAREVGEQEDGYPGGDIVRYRCPNCGTTWKTELPQ